MYPLENLLSLLRENTVDVLPAPEGLRLRPAARVTPEIAQLARENKAALLWLLERRRHDWPAYEFPLSYRDWEEWRRLLHSGYWSSVWVARCCGGRVPGECGAEVRGFVGESRADFSRRIEAAGWVLVFAWRCPACSK